MVTSKKTKLRVAPSRQRYEASHPTVTVRVDRKLYDELRALKEQTGQSVADVLKVGLGKAQAASGEAYEKALVEGYEIGFEQAKVDYEVTYWCARCRLRHLSINSDEEKEAAANFMYLAGWQTEACSEG